MMRAMAECGVGVNGLAEEIGVCRQTVGHILNLRATPRYEVARKLCLYLGLDIEEFYEGLRKGLEEKKKYAEPQEKNHEDQ